MFNLRNLPYITNHFLNGAFVGTLAGLSTLVCYSQFPEMDFSSTHDAIYKNLYYPPHQPHSIFSTEMFNDPFFVPKVALISAGTFAYNAILNVADSAEGETLRPPELFVSKLYNLFAHRREEQTPPQVNGTNRMEYR